MNKKDTEFLAEGMRRYKEATDVLRVFVTNIEAELQHVLDAREDWSPLVPTEGSTASSTRYWSTYPLLNARRKVTYNDKECLLILNINWFEAEGNYPFYAVALATSQKRLSVEATYESDSAFFVTEDGLCMYPDPDDFNIHRDFNLLLDELFKHVSGT